MTDANAANMSATATAGLNLTSGGTDAFANTGGLTFTGMSGSDSQALSINYTRANGTVDNYTATLDSTSGDTVTDAVAALNTAFHQQRPGDPNAPLLTATNNAGNIDITLDPTSNTTENSSNAQIAITQTAITGTDGLSQDGAGTAFTNSTPVNFAGSSGTAIDLTSDSFNSANTLNKIDAAITKVNNLRVNLGAFESNNLQSNLNSLSVASENTSASQSDIEDTDMVRRWSNSPIARSSPRLPRRCSPRPIRRRRTS